MEIPKFQAQVQGKLVEREIFVGKIRITYLAVQIPDMEHTEAKVKDILMGAIGKNIVMTIEEE